MYHYVENILKKVNLINKNMKIDFITLSNIIFKDKNNYKLVTDEEKESNFFILNRKFAFKFLKQAQFFNNKNINKSSSMDLWYQFFYNTTNGTPAWWWLTKTNKKTKSDISNTDLKMVKQYHELTNNDIKFLSIYFKDYLKNEIKRIKKFSN